MRLKDYLDNPSTRTPALTLGVLVALAVVLAGVAVLQSRDNGPSQAAATTLVLPTTTTSTTLAADPSASSTTTLAPSAPVATVTPSPGATTPGPTPPPTVAPPVQTTAPPPPEPVACGPDQADQTLTTDKTTYGAGEIVNVTTRVHNHSGTSCALPDQDSNCYTLLVAYLGSDIRPVWRSTNTPPISCSVFPRRSLLPGASATIQGSWDQMDRRGCPPDGSDPGCTKPRVPGSYIIRSGWLSEGRTTTIALV